MTLTIEQYEQYKKKLADMEKDAIMQEAKQVQLTEHLKAVYDYTPEEAALEVARLEVELPKLEAEAEAAVKDFMEKFAGQLL